MLHPCRLVAIILLAFSLIIAIWCSSGCISRPGSPEDRILPPAGRTAPGILASVPDVRQSTPYSCGASALQAVLGYWGKDMSEADLLLLLNSTGERGTPPRDIVNVSRALGFPAEFRDDVTLPELISATRAGIPVIVGTWTWRNSSSSPLWADDRYYGHYMVVIGIDEENVYLEDPAVGGTRGVLSPEEFQVRWRDLSSTDIRNPDTMRCRRIAVFIRGDIPEFSPEIMPGG